MSRYREHEYGFEPDENWDDPDLDDEDNDEGGHDEDAWADMARER